MHNTTATTRPLPLQLVLLCSILRRWKRSEIPRHMEATDVFALERNDVVNIVRDSSFSGQAFRLCVYGGNGRQVNPRWRAGQFRRATFGRSGMVARSVRVIVGAADSCHALRVRLSPNAIEFPNLFCVRRVVGAVCLSNSAFPAFPAFRSDHSCALNASAICNRAGRDVTMLAWASSEVGRKAGFNSRVPDGCCALHSEIPDEVYRPGLLVQQPVQGFDAVAVNEDHFCRFRYSASASRTCSETERSVFCASSRSAAKSSSGRKKFARIMRTLYTHNTYDTYGAALYLPGMNAEVSREF